MQPGMGHTKEYIKNKVLGGTHYRLSPTELLMMQPSSSDISSQSKRRKQFAASDLKVDDRLGDMVVPNCHFKLFEVIAGDEAKWLEEAVDMLFQDPAHSLSSRQAPLYTRSAMYCSDFVQKQEFTRCC